MNYLFVFFLLLSGSLFAQKLDLKSDSVVIIIDGVYIKEFLSCDYDTIVKIHKNTSFVISDSTLYNYTFESGTKKYFELRIKTKNCSCKDCQRFMFLVIEFNNLNENEIVKFNSSNSTYVYWNSWISPKLETNVSGELRKDKDKYSLILHQYYHVEQKCFIEKVELKNLQVKQ